MCGEASRARWDRCLSLRDGVSVTLAVSWGALPVALYEMQTFAPASPRVRAP
jgi:hypothetical protein